MITQINNINDLKALILECQESGMQDYDNEMIFTIATAIKESNFPVNQAASILDRSRTELLALAASQGVTGFTVFN
tara:strand:- start:251 stop:478 length:228 start_codon:yes stop_codon:yes gene_type:complete